MPAFPEMALLSICGCLKWSVQGTLRLRGSLMNLDIYRATPESRWTACCLRLRQLNLNISILNPAKCHWNWEQSADVPMLYEICSPAEHGDGTCMFSLRRPGPHVLSFSFPAEGPQTLNSCWLINTRLFSKDVLFHCKASAGYVALKGVQAFIRIQVLLVFLQGHPLGTEKPEPHVEL